MGKLALLGLTNERRGKRRDDANHESDDAEDPELRFGNYRWMKAFPVERPERSAAPNLG
jgi:hypothetical protein